MKQHCEVTTSLTTRWSILSSSAATWEKREDAMSGRRTPRELKLKGNQNPECLQNIAIEKDMLDDRHATSVIETIV
jgi:hypothetical protein